MNRRTTTRRRATTNAAMAAGVLPLAISLLPLAHPGVTTPATTATVVAVGSFDGCPDAGSGGDPQLNTEKNRSDAAANPQPITVQYLKGLPTVPEAKGTSRSAWPAQYQTQVTSYERRPVVLTAYIIRAKGEGAETCNCKLASPNDHDVHVYVSDNPDDTQGDSVIVEVTPRWRAVNPSWTWENLEQTGQSGSEVRITGWLLYDQEHWNMIRANPRQRASLWEIHPITRIEVQTQQGWVDFAGYQK